MRRPKDFSLADRAPVEIGLSLPNRSVLHGLDPAELLEAAEMAEDTGSFSSVWVGDNLVSSPRLESVVTLSAIAARTRRVKLGTITMASFVLRDLPLLAIQWASLDQISGGRTVLSVSAGAPPRQSPEAAQEYRLFGVNGDRRVARLEEGVDLLRELWEGVPVSARGRYYNLEQLRVLPRPAQAKIPIVIAVAPSPTNPAVEERALRRVAAHADGWQTAGFSEACARQWRMIRSYAGDYGRADRLNHFSQHVLVKMGASRTEARADAQSFLETYYGKGSAPCDPSYVDSQLLLGSARDIAEGIGRRISAGVTVPVIRFASYDQRRELEEFDATVIPVLADQWPIRRLSD